MSVYEFRWDGHFWAVKKRVPFLNEEVEICIISEDMEKQRPTRRQIAMIAALGALPKATIDEIDDAAERYRKEVDDGIDLSEYDLGHINRLNIRQHYRVGSIVIPRLGQSAHKFYFIAADCDWEMEHGMEILFRDDEILSCGGQDCLYLNQEWDDFIADCN